MSQRADLVTDAALGVLGRDGSRGLSHRAVDRAAGLPDGSTSNLFRTRAALLEGAQARISARGRAVVDDIGDVLGDDRTAAADLIATRLLAYLDSPADLAAARLELALEARRHPTIAAMRAADRANGLRQAADWLAGLGCVAPHDHAAPFLSVLEGVVTTQLVEPELALQHDDVVAILDRWLAAC